MDLVHICNDLLGIGIPVRGGITVGKLIHDELKCFGPAMVEAYKIESEIAVFPRVIIKPKVMEYDLKRPGEANTVAYEAEFLRGLIKRDSRDEQIFLDYMKQSQEFDTPEMYYEYVRKTREFIIENLDKYATDKELLRKYKWLKRYYNKTIKSVYEEAEDLIIKSKNG